MSTVFLYALNLGLSAGWLILAVILARLLLRKAPKRFTCLLWALAAVRLLFPFSVESALSLNPGGEMVPVNITEMQSPAIHAGIEVVNAAVNPILAQRFAPEPGGSANPLQIVVPVLSAVWLMGIAAMLGYALVRSARLRKSVSASVPAGQNIRMCDEVQSPFILGIFRPMIYVPSSMDGETLRYVITHEEAHLRRRDHWWKPLGYLLLCVYWFQPLVWLGYILFCRDLELSCDERVIRDYDDLSRAAYSEALLSCAFPRRKLAVCPLAFGELGVKERVKNVLSYRKPVFRVTALAVLLCIVVGVCFLTTRREREPDLSFLNYENAGSLASQSEAVQAIYCPPVEDGANGVICVGTADGNSLGRFLLGAAWRGRSAPLRSPASPGSVEFILREDYRVTVYQKPRLARVTHGTEMRYYQIGQNDYENAAALFQPDGTELPTSSPGIDLKSMDLWDMLTEEDSPEGVWSYSDGSISVSFTRNEDRSITGTIQKDGKTVGLSIGCVAIKGTHRRLVFQMYDSTYGQEPEYRLCEGQMKSRGGNIVFTLDKDGEAYFGRKKLLFTFSQSAGKPASAAEKWFDFYNGDDVLWDEVRETSLPEFPGVTFRCSPAALEAVMGDETVTLYDGMPIMSVYFCDLNSDGLRELCSTVSVGSGIIDERIYVADYANNAVHELSDRGRCNYRFSLKDGRPWAEKYPYGSGVTEAVKESGYLTIHSVVGTDGELVPTLMFLKSSFSDAELIEADQQLIDRAWTAASDFAEADGLTLELSGAKVFRYTDGLSADVVFPEADGLRSVSVSFTVSEDGTWRVLPAGGVQLIEKR